ncbi:sensor domain-containing protein [Candidatus Colwellia aromaticivorans]|uniref:sensor domain-containing protein n=1 Tax=Candidatus Colwellia aromaticivorans TaxID=2267621 RepID=UPI000DF469DF|nr:bifunctional diguanylate cyclase/phosphodiesterase [Candidatus Colwellia aromaticivorans]
MKNNYQQQLKEEQEKNRLLLDIINAIPEPVFAKDNNGNFIFANKALADFYNTIPDEMVGKDDFHFTGNMEQSNSFKENVQAIMNNKKPEVIYEDATDTNTGETHSFRSLKVPFTNSEGEDNIVIIATNVTDLIALKNQAEKNERRLAGILEVSGEGMWDWNTQTNDVFHNNRWEVITGVSNADNSFEEFQRCIFEEDKEIVNSAIKRLLEENIPYDIEFRMQRPNDNKQIWIWDRGMVLEHNDQGEPLWVVGIMQDVTDKIINQKKIENLAFYDVLTQLPNRALLQDRMKQAIEYFKRSNIHGAILFLDLDQFKQLNDTYGHHAGDNLLIEVANRIQSTIRTEDTVARFGGDEFVIILNALNPDLLKAALRVENIASNILQAVNKPYQLQTKKGEVDYVISASIGITMIDSIDIGASKLLQLADVALYRAKANGRDNFVMFDPEMQKELSYTTKLEKDLRLSIKQNNFELYYQPQYNIKGDLIAAEGLIRWHHPELGLVNPSDFIDVAEESNLIIPIGSWVLTEACKQLKEFQLDYNYQHLSISINISAKQIWQKNFVSETIKIVTESQIDKSKLKLELTESVLLKDMADTVEKLRELQLFGLNFSLDDFGTGYSSLGYLKHLPISEIKIDQSFIQDIIDEKSDLIMVKTMIGLGKNFGLDVVAEGIESKAKLDILSALDCNIYQGFHFNKPLPLDEFLRLI